MKTDSRAGNIDRLRKIMKALRDPDSGCPWDIAQTPVTIAPYAIEEAYELEAAIREGDVRDIRDELGDLLLQVVFQSQMAEESGNFTFESVVESICDKMERRHPHIFSTDANPDIDQQGVKKNWEAIKAEERQTKGRGGLLDDIAVTLPGMLRAVKLQKRMASVGFDWDELEAVIDKVKEELSELEVEIQAKKSANIQAELGDLLFAVVNLARHCGINPETAIKETNTKVTKRFTYIEQHFPGREAMKNASLSELDQLWNQAKIVVDKSAN